MAKLSYFRLSLKLLRIPPHSFELDRVYSSIIKPRSRYIILTHSLLLLYLILNSIVFSLFLFVRYFLVLNIFLISAHNVIFVAAITIKSSFRCCISLSLSQQVYSYKICCMPSFTFLLCHVVMVLFYEKTCKSAQHIYAIKAFAALIIIWHHFISFYWSFIKNVQQITFIFLPFFLKKNDCIIFFFFHCRQ